MISTGPDDCAIRGDCNGAPVCRGVYASRPCRAPPSALFWVFRCRKRTLLIHALCACAAGPARLPLRFSNQFLKRLDASIRERGYRDPLLSGDVQFVDPSVFSHIVPYSNPATWPSSRTISARANRSFTASGSFSCVSGLIDAGVSGEDDRGRSWVLCRVAIRLREVRFRSSASAAAGNRAARSTALTGLSGALLSGSVVHRC